MVTWKEVYVQEEMRKVRMAQAENARMVKIAKAAANAKSGSQKKKPYLVILGAATKLVKATGSLKVQESEVALASES